MKNQVHVLLTAGLVLAASACGDPGVDFDDDGFADDDTQETDDAEETDDTQETDDTEETDEEIDSYPRSTFDICADFEDYREWDDEALCTAKCEKGRKPDGFGCIIEDCPPGFVRSGDSYCRKPDDYIYLSLLRLTGEVTCETRRGCSQTLEYLPCRSGYHEYNDLGTHYCLLDCPAGTQEDASNRTNCFLTHVAPAHTRPAPSVCPQGWEVESNYCYEPCDQGYEYEADGDTCTWASEE